MGRKLASGLYPAIAALVGVVVSAVAVWRGVEAASAVAVGLAVFAALLSVRNWRVVETERPLLADELMGLHDAVDALRDDAVVSREKMKDLAEVLEEAVAAGAVAVETGQTSGANAAFAGVAGFRATRALEAKIARLESSFGDMDARLVSVADAIETALSRSDDALDDEADLDFDDAIEGANRTGRDLSSRAAADHISRPMIVEDETPYEPESASDHIEDADIDWRVPSRTEEIDISGARSTEESSPDEAASVEEERQVDEPPQAPAASGALAVSVSEPPKTEPAPRQTQFSAAMADKPFDLSLQPIISLADREPRYFEAMFGDGADPAASLVKAAAVARRLSSAGQETPVLCLASMAALRNEATLRGFLNFASGWDDLSDALRLEFLQSDIEIENPRDIAVLQQLRAKGFMFSVGRVTDLSMDIARLARAGFRTVKLDVGLVFSREQAESAQNAVVKRLVSALDRAGLELVLENLDAVDLVKRAREAGARLGQGEAIAPPRLAAVESAWLTESGEPEAVVEREPETV